MNSLLVYAVLFFKKHKWVWFCMIGLFLTFIGTVFYTQVWREYFEHKRVVSLCQKEIKAVLKSPATAQFSNFQQIWDNLVAYDVDAQNSYWALIRGKFICNPYTEMGKSKILDIHGINISDFSVSTIEDCIALDDWGKGFSECLSLAKEVGNTVRN